MASSNSGSAARKNKIGPLYVRPIDEVHCLQKARRHEPLRSENHIRLLKLYPPGWPDRVHCPKTSKGSDLTVKCDIYQASLEDLKTEGLPYYTALSYVWGPPEKSRVIQCDGGNVGVGQNLYDALVWVRRRYQPMLLWVDAICIAQANDAEKSVQVQRMRYVFEGAHVVSWLGRDLDTHVDEEGLYFVSRMGIEIKPHDPISDLGRAFDVIAKFSKLRLEEYPRTGNRQKEVVESAWLAAGHSAAELRNLPWSALSRLYLNQYFTRLWVVQEVRLSRSLICRIGARTIPMKRLYRAYRLLIWLDPLSPFSRRTGLSDSLIDFYGMYALGRMFLDTIEDTYGPTPSVTQPDKIVQRYVSHECSDPKDRIYGLVALFTEADQSQYPVDYSMSTQDVYTEFALACIRSSRRLDLFSSRCRSNLSRLHRQMDYHGSAGLSSWTPDWRDPEWGFRWLDLGLYDASNGREIMLTKPIGRVLKLLGLETGKITTVSDHLTDLDGTHVNHLAKMKSAERVALKLSTSVEPSKLWLVYVDVLTAGNIDSFRGRILETLRRIEPCTQQMPAKYRYQVALHTFGPIWLSQCSKQMFRAAKLVLPSCPEDERRRLAKILRDHISCESYGTRMFTTDNGMLGTAPDGAHVGDIVCVLYGGRVPFILREVGNKGQYKLIGEAYVHGIMHGEALEMGLKEKEFPLI